MPRPEEEWLNQPEREGSFERDDPTRSPYEGDIPPWGQKGYEGAFPMEGKVFYITAYLGLGQDRVSRSTAPATSPVLGEAFPVRDVGNVPEGSFGSDFMYFPFAAIPVRNEDRAEIGPVVDYLAAIIQELGVYGKILLEPSFPTGKEVQLPNGRWFPVELSQRDYGGIDFLNAYNINRLYGGGEEGGWWFDSGNPVASVPLRSEDPASMDEWKDYLEKKVSWTSKYDRYSVLGHDDFGTRLEDFFAMEFPQETPHYE